MSTHRYPMKHHGYARDLHACHERTAGTLGAPTVRLASPGPGVRVDDVVVTGETVTVYGTGSAGSPITIYLPATAAVIWYTEPSGARL